MPTPTPITVHAAALAALQGNYLSTRRPRIADWLIQHGGDRFVRLYVPDFPNPHVIVAMAAWIACGADVLGIEAEIAAAAEQKEDTR